MAGQITNNAIQQIWNNTGIKDPTVVSAVPFFVTFFLLSTIHQQIIDVKRIQTTGGNAPERYRLVISDGEFYQQAMLATQLNALVTNQQIQPKCMITLNEYICNKVHDRQIAIILKLTVAAAPLPNTVGNPKNIEGSAKAGAGAHPTTNQPSAPAPSKYQAPPKSATPYSAPPQHQQQRSAPPKYGASNVPQTAEPNVFPIASLNPYQTQWRIKARVTQKGDVKTWENTRGAGKLISFELLDAAGGRIRATMFNEAVDVFDPILTQGQTYYLSGGKLKLANKRFNTTPNNYEITFDRNAVITRADDDSEIPQIKFNFVPIEQILEVDPDTVIDVLGVIRNVEPVTEITTKKGNQLSKREVTIGDSSKYTIVLTLWGKQAEDFDASGILAIQGARVSDYNQRSLSTSFSSVVMVNPDLQEAHRLRGWYDGAGQTAEFTDLTVQGFRREGGVGGKFPPTQYKSVAQLTEEQLGRRGQGPEYVMLTGSITTIKHDKTPWYDACPTCNKRVDPVQGGGGSGFYCERCQKQTPNCARRYILRATFCDHTGSTWVNGFDEQGVSILGVSAQQMYDWNESGDPNYQRTFDNALFKQYTVKVKVFEDNYNDEARLKVTMLNVFDHDPAKQIERLKADIAKYAALGYVPSMPAM